MRLSARRSGPASHNEANWLSEGSPVLYQEGLLSLCGTSSKVYLSTSRVWKTIKCFARLRGFIRIKDNKAPKTIKQIARTNPGVSSFNSNFVSSDQLCLIGNLSLFP